MSTRHTDPTTEYLHSRWNSKMGRCKLARNKPNVWWSIKIRPRIRNVNKSRLINALEIRSDDGIILNSAAARTHAVFALCFPKLDLLRKVVVLVGGRRILRQCDARHRVECQIDVGVVAGARFERLDTLRSAPLWHVTWRHLANEFAMQFWLKSLFIKPSYTVQCGLNYQNYQHHYLHLKANTRQFPYVIGYWPGRVAFEVLLPWNAYSKGLC